LLIHAVAALKYAALKNTACSIIFSQTAPNESKSALPLSDSALRDFPASCH
jgi:hypothetical protein